MAAAHTSVTLILGDILRPSRYQDAARPKVPDVPDDFSYPICNKVDMHVEERSYIGRSSPRCIVSQSKHLAKPHNTSSEVRIQEIDLFGNPFPLRSTLVIDHVLFRVVSHVPSTVLQVCNDLRLQLGSIASGSKTELATLSVSRDVSSPRHC